MCVPDDGVLTEVDSFEYLAVHFTPSVALLSAVSIHNSPRKESENAHLMCWVHAAVASDMPRNDC